MAFILLKFMWMRKTLNTTHSSYFKHFIVWAICLNSMNVWSLPQANPNKLITPEEFRVEIEEHRERVHKAALILIQQLINNNEPHVKQLKQLYDLNSGLFRSLVSSYFYYHDWPKTQVSFFRQLYENYGIKFDGTPKFINELNALEKEAKDIFLMRIIHNHQNIFNSIYPGYSDYEILKTLNSLLKWIEDIVDFTDTKIFRGKELNFIPKPLAAKQMFIQAGDAKAAEYSEWLEKNVLNQFKKYSCKNLF